MQIFVEIGPLKAYLKLQRARQSTIGLVPTMGALHAGHLSLIRSSKSQNDITVCSIYVNPAQFNNPSDLDKYPRTFDSDAALLKTVGCDIIFAPSNNEMYPQVSELKFDFDSLDKVFEGEFRPGHFSGVALVVAKLFNIVQPNKAYFGQKDFQQFRIISKLVEELNFDIDLVCAPIVREADGLAMSSRNRRLNKDERRTAVIVNECLLEARAKLLAGESFTSVKNHALSRFKSENVRLEYFAMADQRALQPLENVADPSNVVLLVAAFLGEVRLIDNLFLIENSTSQLLPSQKPRSIR
ncbi:pantoate--beta-alanine ligase [soil metagenome]